MSPRDPAAALGQALLRQLKCGDDAEVTPATGRCVRHRGRKRAGQGVACRRLFQRSCELEASLPLILQIYHAASTNPDLSSRELMANSCLCQTLLWKTAEQNKWSDFVLFFSEPLARMAKHRHWNFLAQLIVTLCDSHQLDVFCTSLFGQACELSQDEMGCRVLVRICEQGRFSEAARRLLEEVASEISERFTHKYSTHVMIKILETFPDFPGMRSALMSCAMRCDTGLGFSNVL